MDNRKKILDCALHLFYARGYDAVGIQEIVDAAGVTKPTMYYYFGSKRGLLEELLKQSFSELSSAIEGAAARHPDERFPEVLYRVAKAFLSYAVGHEEAYRFILALFYTGAENEGHKAVEPMISDYYGRLVCVFEEASGELGNMNGRQRQFALGLQGLLDTTFLMYCSRPREERTIPDEATIRSILQQFMYGIYS